MSLPALYIGRFQPFHLGHLDAIKQILGHQSNLFIAIGSAQESNTETNPFSFELRKKIIELSLEEAEIQKEKYKILPLNDIHDDLKWCDYVDKTLPPYGPIYTGSSTTKTLYDRQKKHPVIQLAIRLPISSTEIRKKRNMGGNWGNLVTKSCYFQLQNGKNKQP